MSDDANLELDGEENAGGEETKKKKGGLGAVLPNLLKFVALGLAALIFIIGVAAFTTNLIMKRGQSQTVIPESSPYQGNRPLYAAFTAIGQVQTRTRDAVPYSVVVDMVIEYDLNDNAAATELTGRIYQLQDFVRNFFSGCTVEQLYPENEARLKQQIIEKLNTQVLNTAKARNILFKKLDYLAM
jgi:flagellar FliL protein